MRLSSLFAPLRRSIARLLPSRSAASTPRRAAPAALDRFVANVPHVAVQRAQALGLAERRHIRAKFALKKAELNLHQVRRKHGPASQQAQRAEALAARAGLTLAGASGSLYASRILFGEPGTLS